MGIIAGDLSREEEDKIGEWFRKYGRPGSYHVGLLRDIYPLNILSKSHLDQQAHGQTLQNWIQASAEHGNLKQLTPELWSWWIPTEQISLVREKLKHTGLLICV